MSTESPTRARPRKPFGAAIAAVIALILGVVIGAGTARRHEDARQLQESAGHR